MADMGSYGHFESSHTGDISPIGNTRLDALLPCDEETGAVTPAAVRVYLSAMLDLVSRSSQTLAVISFGVDATEEAGSLAKHYGKTGASLIGRAVARCLRQETRGHDVVGCAGTVDINDLPIFIVVCPLKDEAKAVHLAERMRAAMMSHSADSDRPWLNVSAGVAALSIDTLDAESLIMRSMGALHAARREEGGSVWGHSDIRRRIAENNEPTWPEESN